MALPVLDHIVVNVRTGMDAAAQAFSGAGFTLTPRGYHTLGSVNHLMVFERDYLELIGVPEENHGARPEVAAAPVGLNGLVFKSGDVDRTFEHLCAVGFDGDPPRSFSRPVECDGVERDASFRTVSVRADVFPFGRVYFCEHLTPELVWRPAWQGHANGATRVDEMVVVASAPGDVAARFSALLEQPVEADGDDAWVALDDCGLRVMTPLAFEARFGVGVEPSATRGAAFGAVVLGVESLARFDAAVSAGGGFDTVLEDSVRRVIRNAAFGTTLEARVAL